MNGLAQGVWTYWDEFGYRTSKITFQDGMEEGYAIIWSPNEVSWEEGNFHEGERQGLWTKFYQGKMVSRGNFNHNLRTGWWMNWDAVTSLPLVNQHYQDGRLLWP